MNWVNVHSISNSNDAYEYFSKVFSGICDLAFPLKTNSVKRKILQNPWMTKDLLKFSKQKQRIYEKSVKKRSPQNENIYKGYKFLFASLKKNLTKLLHKTSRKKLKRYKEILGCNQEDYMESKIN